LHSAELLEGLIVCLVRGIFSKAAEAFYHLAHELNTIFITKCPFTVGGCGEPKPEHLTRTTSRSACAIWREQKLSHSQFAASAIHESFDDVSDLCRCSAKVSFVSQVMKSYTTWSKWASARP